MDASNALFAPGGLPLGMLAMLFSGQQQRPAAQQAPSDADVANATAQLAARMRQQSTDVPPPEKQTALNDGDTFDQRWTGILNTPTSANIPLPQPRPAGAPLSLPSNALDQTMLDQLPQNSAPTQGTVPPSVAAPASTANASSPGLGDRLLAGLANFGAGGRQGGLLGALTGAIQGGATGQRIDPLGMMNQTAQVLVNRGVPQDMAQIMARDPQLLNQVLPLIMGVKPWQVTETTDMFGQRKPILINPITGESKAVNISGGAPRGGVSNVAGIPGAPSATPPLDNFDMSSVNPNLKGADYVKQFPQEVQSAVQAYLQGGVMPTGNPRNQGIANVAKMVAQKYAMDIGQPQLADDALFSQRRKMRTDLGSSSPNTMGGILSNGKSAFEHLGTLSDAMVNLGNYNGPNVPGGALVGETGNYIGNTLGATAATKDKLQQVKDAALKFGQESTKYYAGTGGGEGERTFALNNATGPSVTGAEQAGFLQTEKSLMMARLEQKEAQVRDTLGDQYLAQHPVVTPELQATLNKIDANIAKLRGQAPQGQPQPTQAAPSPIRVTSPQQAIALPRGTQFIDPNGVLRVR